ncbi:MAG TPA: hypothetical protein VGL19_14000 [Polyangiaceae bacterium]
MALGLDSIVERFNIIMPSTQCTPRATRFSAARREQRVQLRWHALETRQLSSRNRE